MYHFLHVAVDVSINCSLHIYNRPNNNCLRPKLMEVNRNDDEGLVAAAVISCAGGRHNMPGPLQVDL